ncbi:MAG TPA: MFS transporter [Chthonomonadaceae bacterium]|nr:MFS transporter [Chthonomonadaceae bacterium]
MGVWAQVRELMPAQRNAFLASFLGWSLDAFDFFVLVFVIPDIAAEFGVKRSDVALSITLTLAFRPVGAFCFGWAADRYGRRVPLMINVLCYSLISLLCGFAPTLTVFLVLRSLFGIAMGGEWGLGAALAMESVPERMRGTLSGVLQEGYVVGYLLAAIVYPLVAPRWGWRAMFFVGVLPALLSVFIRARVQESPVWEQQQREREAGAAPLLPFSSVVRQHFRLFAYLILLMTAFNFMSHGTQDLYPTFLKEQHKLGPGMVSRIVILYNIGALLGGICFGSLSESIGRRRAIILAALLALPIVPLWAFSPFVGLLALGAFLMQFMVQGAWGVIPAHLSELAPNTARSTFTGFTYQLGNLLAAINAYLQARLAERPGWNYAMALSSVVVVVLLAVALITALGKEARGARFADG